MAVTIFNLPVQYVRQQASPIDIDSVFTTTAARNTYLTSPRRYAGQIVSDLQDGNVYQLNAARTAWVIVGSGGGGGETVLSLDFKCGGGGAPADSATSFTFDGSAIVNLIGKTLLQFHQQGTLVSKIALSGGVGYITFNSGTGTITWTNGSFSADPSTFYSLLYK